MDRQMRPFRDRRHAGEILSSKLKHLSGNKDIVVLGVPRGGVPVAFEVARSLSAALDVFVVRKIGLPGHEEFAIGAIASGGARVMNDEVIESLEVDQVLIDAVIEQEEKELERRERLYRGSRDPLDVRRKRVVLVDDGLATGSSMRAAIRAIRALSPERIIVAVPVGAPETCEALAVEADEVICGETPDPFYAVGLWYEDFSQTTDEEVRELLERASHAPA